MRCQTDFPSNPALRRDPLEKKAVTNIPQRVKPSSKNKPVNKQRYVKPFGCRGNRLGAGVVAFCALRLQAPQLDIRFLLLFSLDGFFSVPSW